MTPAAAFRSSGLHSASASLGRISELRRMAMWISGISKVVSGFPTGDGSNTYLPAFGEIILELPCLTSTSLPNLER